MNRFHIGWVGWLDQRPDANKHIRCADLFFGEGVAASAVIGLGRTLLLTCGLLWETDVVESWTHAARTTPSG
jgi:hypothetical protein